jgi:threonine aldolase
VNIVKGTDMGTMNVMTDEMDVEIITMGATTNGIAMTGAVTMGNSAMTQKVKKIVAVETILMTMTKPERKNEEMAGYAKQNEPQGK